MTVVIADKGYDQQALLATIETKGGEAVISTRKNNTNPRVIDADQDKDRNLVERLLSKAK